jgi:hypothetical protein
MAKKITATVETSPITLETLTNAQLVTMSSVDVRANLRTLIDYCDGLLTRSAVIYSLILTTAEGASEKPVPFLISAFADVWPKADVADKDGNFPLLGFSTVEKKVREKQLSLTGEQESAFKKVNAFRMFVLRQKANPNSVPPAKTLPKKLLEAITKLRGLVDHAVEVEVVFEDENGDEAIRIDKVVNVNDLAALIEVISQV